MSVHLHHLVAAAAAALFLSGGFISSARAQPDEYFDAVWCGVILTDGMTDETRPGVEAAREAARRIAESYVESGAVSEDDIEDDGLDAYLAWGYDLSDEEAEQEIAGCIQNFQYR